MERYDVLIIGAGPAALSAAITLKIRGKNVLVLGNSAGNTGVSEKVEKAHVIQNYLGVPNVKGSDLAAAFAAHAKEMQIEQKVDQVLAVYAMGDYFHVTTRSDAAYDASAVILATGVSFGKPFPGEETFLGRGVSYCATCDAMLYRGKRTVVIGAMQEAEQEAAFLAELAAEVVYVPLYNTSEETLRETFEKCAAGDRIRIVRDIPVEIAGSLKANKLVMQKETIETDGIFILRESVSPKALVPGLQVEGNHVVVNRKMETSLAGCFACGDITGTPYQYIKAAGEGNVAALSAVEYLSKLQAK